MNGISDWRRVTCSIGSILRGGQAPTDWQRQLSQKMAWLDNLPLSWAWLKTPFLALLRLNDRPLLGQSLGRLTERLANEPVTDSSESLRQASRPGWAGDWGVMGHSSDRAGLPHQSTARHLPGVNAPRVGREVRRSPPNIPVPAQPVPADLVWERNRKRSPLSLPSPLDLERQAGPMLLANLGGSMALAQGQNQALDQRPLKRVIDRPPGGGDSFAIMPMAITEQDWRRNVVRRVRRSLDHHRPAAIAHVSQPNAVDDSSSKPTSDLENPWAVSPLGQTASPELLANLEKLTGNRGEGFDQQSFGEPHAPERQLSSGSEGAERPAKTSSFSPDQPVPAPSARSSVPSVVASAMLAEISPPSASKPLTAGATLTLTDCWTLPVNGQTASLELLIDLERRFGARLDQAENPENQRSPSQGQASPASPSQSSAPVLESGGTRNHPAPTLTSNPGGFFPDMAFPDMAFPDIAEENRDAPDQLLGASARIIPSSPLSPQRETYSSLPDFPPALHRQNRLAQSAEATATAGILPPTLQPILPELLPPQAAALPPLAVATPTLRWQARQEDAPEADLEWLSAKIKHILDEEARRHGIDV